MLRKSINSFLSKERFWDLFICSFSALFFELLLIRWLPTSIYILGYFKNCILFATFLGFGVGCATRYSHKRIIPLFSILVSLFVVIVKILEKYTMVIPWQTGEVLWPQFKIMPFSISLHIMLLVVFIITALLMIPLGHQVGKHLNKFKPIPAYSINIGASLLAIVIFLILGFLQLGPFFWFSIQFLSFFYILRNSKLGILLNIFSITIVLATLIYFSSPNETWSPYYKITIQEKPDLLTNSRLISVNNNGHQVIFDFSPKYLSSHKKGNTVTWRFMNNNFYIYNSAYAIKRPTSVLIIGGGTGNEAAAALRNGVEKIHVVEIDPVIINIGFNYHPEKPYQNPHVKIINDDARHYMATTKEQYDLIIFGFLDSQSCLSAMSNIRLDNYVYTLESFNNAKDILTSDGLLQVTYYSIVNFIRIRIYATLLQVFKQSPQMYTLNNDDGVTLLFAGPAITNKHNVKIPGLVRKIFLRLPPIHLATDDWPYLNLPGHQIGRDYLAGLGIMFLISFFIVYGFLLKGNTQIYSKRMSFSWMFFLQGTIFMLLETNTITRMALLMGSTWIVTSLSIVFVLIAALTSNYIVHNYTFPSLKIIFLFLLTTLSLNYVVKFDYWLNMNRTFGIISASLWLYLPILGSSLLFGRLFQQSKENNYHFGINILGAILGGMLEYLSLIKGINSIYLVTLLVLLVLMWVHEKSIKVQFR